MPSPSSTIRTAGPPTGVLLTIDMMVCQTAIAERMVECGADYPLPEASPVVIVQFDR